MKIKNIVFSGVMGAILATAANAAPTIASKAYVDGLVGDNVTNLTQTIEANHKEIGLNAAAIAENTGAIADMDAAYKLADEATLSSAKGYTDEEITKLNNSLSSTGGNVTALEKRVSTNETNITDLTQTVADNKAAAEQAVKALTEGAVTTNASNIAKNATAISELTTTVTNNATAAQQAVDNLTNGAVKANTTAIETLNGSGEGSVAKKIADAIGASESAAANKYAEKTYVDSQDDALDARIAVNENYIEQHKTEYQTLNSSVSTNTANIATNTGNITTLMANAETTGSVDNKVATSAAQTKTAYETYAIPKPSDSDCNAASGLCVLSVSADGQTLTWVDVTDTVTAGESSDTTGE